VGFPEGSNMKAPRDSDFPFGAFLFSFQAVFMKIEHPFPKGGRL